MKILITNNNIDFFLQLNPKLKISPSTQNTSVINCTEKTFVALREKVREKNINPYAVMAW